MKDKDLEKLEDIEREQDDFYSVVAICNNCLWEGETVIMCGKKVSEHPCPKCGVKLLEVLETLNEEE